jgi:hypothetical protein
MFEADFQKVKRAAVEIGKNLAAKICHAKEILTLDPKIMEKFISETVRNEPSIQFVAITNRDGKQIMQVHTQRGDKGLFRSLFDVDFKEKEWFRNVIDTGESYWSDLFFSRFTNRLIMTFAEPIRDTKGNIVAVLDVDFKFDDLMKLVNQLQDNQQ